MRIGRTLCNGLVLAGVVFGTGVRSQAQSTPVEAAKMFLEAFNAGDNAKAAALSDRPQVIPERSGNLAFLGQFCELPDDVAFTVEYSVRTAQTAVYEMLGLDRKPPPMYKGSHDLRTLREAILTLHGFGVNPAH
jgi:hypothetical protein